MHRLEWLHKEEPSDELEKNMFQGLSLVEFLIPFRLVKIFLRFSLPLPQRSEESSHPSSLSRFFAKSTMSIEQVSTLRTAAVAACVYRGRRESKQMIFWMFGISFY